MTKAHWFKRLVTRAIKKTTEWRYFEVRDTLAFTNLVVESSRPNASILQQGTLGFDERSSKYIHLSNT